MITPQNELRSDGKVRLPPNQYLATDWPVLHCGTVPRIDLRSWTFHVWGLVEEEKQFAWDEFNALGQVTDISDIHCVTTWSKYDNEWQGIPFSALLDAIKLKPEAEYAMLHSYGGYTTNLSLADLKREGVLFANSHNGEPLAIEHGWPLRLVVPHLYLWKSAKWVGGIQFLDRDQPGFWETHGHHMRGDPWREERYSRTMFYLS